MRIARKLIMASLITSLAVWAAGCGDQGGGGGGSGTGGGGTTPVETPTVETDMGTPAGPDSGDTGSSDAPAGGGWGTLKGRFVFDGDRPTQAKLEITKDTEFCTKDGNPLDESLIVSENGGLRNVLVWIYVGRRDKPPEIHESFKDLVGQPTRMDNITCRFEPHVQFCFTGQDVVIGNKDEVGHNTKGDMNANAPFNETISQGEEITKKFEKAERVPAAVSCSIHPWMKGYLHVLDHPYVAVTDADGNFEIANIPTGRWTFQVWHEVPGSISAVTLDGKQKTWAKGRVEFDITEGEVDLGEIKVAAALFGK